jgi:hypothetical protein
MQHHNHRQMKLSDVIRIVAEYSRNDHEVGLVVADLLQRGVVRVHTRQGRRHQPRR